MLNVTTYNKTSDSFSLLQVYANIATKDLSRAKAHRNALAPQGKSLIINRLSVRLQFYDADGIRTTWRARLPTTALASAVTDKEPETLTTSPTLIRSRSFLASFSSTNIRIFAYYQQTRDTGQSRRCGDARNGPDHRQRIGQIRRSGNRGRRHRRLDEGLLNDSREPHFAVFERAGNEANRARLCRGLGDGVKPRLLKTADADKSVQFTRKANEFTLVLPLSPHDTDEAIATMNLAKTIVAERTEGRKARRQPHRGGCSAQRN